MSERRVDPFTNHAVWIAPGRAGLGATRPGGLPTLAGRCPFCPGHEVDAEPTVAQWPPDGPWRARVVRNKYPLLGPPYGDHEVGIDAAEHDADLGDMSPAHVAGVLGLYRDRYRALAARPEVAAVMLFRNRGRRAGSSQPHPHTQLVALPEVPESLRVRSERVRGRPLHQEEQAQARDAGRVLLERGNAISLCPFAPSRAHQVRIAPTSQAGGFEDATDSTIADVATLLVTVLQRVTGGLGIRDYNLALRSLPEATSWSLDVLPRTGGDAGFELASLERVVVVAPETTAARLRSLG